MLRGKRKRMRLGGGGRLPAVELEYALFNWYVDMRAAVTSRIWPHTLRNAAECIKGKLLTMAKEAEQPPPWLPKISPAWIWKFMKKFHIVWRKATVRYKVSRVKMDRRAKRTWTQAFKVQHGLQLLHGEERCAKGHRRFHTHLVAATVESGCAGCCARDTSEKTSTNYM
jgi:hypothetical protein